MSLQRKPRLTMYLTMYLSKKSYTMQTIENGRTTERPLIKILNINLKDGSIISEEIF